MLTARPRQAGLCVGGQLGHHLPASGSRAVCQTPSATVPKPSRSWPPSASISSQASRAPCVALADRLHLEMLAQQRAELVGGQVRQAARPADASAG